MEHRAASLVGQKLAASQLLYGDAVAGALVQQSDSGRGFLADLTRNLIEQSEIADLNTLFRRVSKVGGNGNGGSEFIGATGAEMLDVTDEEEIAAGAATATAEGGDARQAEARAFEVAASTRQMVLFQAGLESGDREERVGPRSLRRCQMMYESKVALNKHTLYATSGKNERSNSIGRRNPD